MVSLRAPDSQAEPPRRPAPPKMPRTKTKGPRVVSTRGATGTVRVGSSRRQGYLSVNTIPWTQVYLSTGRLLGITPLARAPLASGRHKLVLKNPSGIKRKYGVVIRPGKETRVRLDLRR